MREKALSKIIKKIIKKKIIKEKNLSPPSKKADLNCPF